MEAFAHRPNGDSFELLGNTRYDELGSADSQPSLVLSIHKILVHLCPCHFRG